MISHSLFLLFCLFGVGYTASSIENQLDRLLDKRGLEADGVKYTLHDILLEAEDAVLEEKRRNLESIKANNAGRGPAKENENLRKFKRAGPNAIKDDMPGRVLVKTRQLVHDRFAKKFGKRSISDWLQKTSLHDLSKRASGQRRATTTECPFKQNKDITCTDKDKLYRSIDGSCNNLKHKNWGIEKSPYVQLMPPDYNGINGPRIGKNGVKLPSARDISNKIGGAFSDRNVKFAHIGKIRKTALLVSVAQHYNHDMTKAEQAQVNFEAGQDCGQCDAKPPCLPIKISTNEMNPDFGKGKCISFTRSLLVPNQDCSVESVNHQSNEVTSFMDSSTLYASEHATAKQLREGFKMRSKPSNIPKQKDLMAINPEFCGADKTKCFEFQTGDIRSNEHGGLSIIHTLWLRNHNILAEKLDKFNKDHNKNWSEEDLFQMTKKINTAFFQKTFYNDYLKEIFGPDELQNHGLLLPQDGFFHGYNESINPSVSSEFATVANRFMHSCIPKYYLRADTSWSFVAHEILRTRQAFFNPSMLGDAKQGGVDSMLRGLCMQFAYAADSHFTDEVRNKLFSAPLDLFAMNIQRGRDHGIPSYNHFRRYCKLPAVTSFEGLATVFGGSTEAKDTAIKFKELYGENNIEEVDAYPAMIAEENRPGSLFGPTIACILTEQYRRSMTADRFFYLNGNLNGENEKSQGFTLAQLHEVRKYSMARLICDNSDAIPTMSRNPFQEPTCPKTPCKPNVPCKEINDIDYDKLFADL